MKFPDKVYDILKWIALVVLPALGVFYTTLAQTWGLPYSEQIPTTIAAVGLFLGALLGFSAAAYHKARK